MDLRWISIVFYKGLISCLTSMSQGPCDGSLSMAALRWVTRPRCCIGNVLGFGSPIRSLTFRATVLAIKTTGFADDDTDPSWRPALVVPLPGHPASNGEALFAEHGSPFP